MHIFYASLNQHSINIQHRGSKKSRLRKEADKCEFVGINVKGIGEYGWVKVSMGG